MRSALLLFCLAGCMLRPSVRRLNPDYRSQEAYGAAHWGMTPAELESVVPDLQPCGIGALCRDEMLKDKPARVTYELPSDQLMIVRLKVPSTDPQADFEKFRHDLTEQYGPRSQLTAARVRVGPYAVVALMDAVGGVYKPILGPFSATEQGWTTPETELRLARGQEVGGGWLELTLTSRMLARPSVSLETP
jgi:hypothetical protein